MKRVAIVGLGYIGLPTAIAAAQAGYEVIGFDIDKEKIEQINQGNPTIFEPEIAEKLITVLNKGTFKAFDDLHYAQVFVITVPTPFKDNKLADLAHVFAAGQTVARRLQHGNLVILESTVPVGTTEKLAKQIEDQSGLKCGVDFFVAYCPERVMPTQIFKELAENSRVIGGICQQACQLAQQFYEKFVRGFLHITDDKTAEMVKLIENSSRDVQIAFANQVDAMCKKAGIDTYDVIELANKHPRVKILSPTCGVGGHCIAVDPWFLIETFPKETALLHTARIINDEKPHQVLHQVYSKAQYLKMLGNKKPNILALGLTFKPNVDDIREAPALKIAHQLAQQPESYTLQAFDPHVTQAAIASTGIVLTTDFVASIQWADIILVLVKHAAFYRLGLEAFGDKIVIDTCGLLYDLEVTASMNASANKSKIKEQAPIV